MSAVAGEPVDGTGPRNAFFVVIEGIDGCGKGTQVERLRKYLESRQSGQFHVLVTSEPTGSDIGKMTRSKLKTEGQIDTRTEALMFAADRRHHVDKVLMPSLRRGDFIICDRYAYSTFAYQGQRAELDMRWLCDLNRFAIIPDLVLFLDVDPLVGQKRRDIRERESGKKAPGDEAEYFERKKGFLEAARMLFQKMASGTVDLRTSAYGNMPPRDFLSTRFITIDASGPIDDVFAKITGQVEELISRGPSLDPSRFETMDRAQESQPGTAR